MRTATIPAQQVFKSIELFREGMSLCATTLEPAMGLVPLWWYVQMAHRYGVNSHQRLSCKARFTGYLRSLLIGL
jgi:hypothetical protein